MTNTPVVLFALSLALGLQSCGQKQLVETQPNILIIYADDMGYGDLKGLLFDLQADPEQRTNLYTQHPVLVQQMDATLHKELNAKYHADYQ